MWFQKYFVLIVGEEKKKTLNEQMDHYYSRKPGGS